MMDSPLSSSSVRVLRRGSAPEAKVEVSDHKLGWSTVAEVRTSDVSGIRAANVSEDGQQLFASNRSGVLGWSHARGSFELFTEIDKSEGNVVQALLVVAGTLWCSIGKGKVVIYKTDSRTVLTKFIAHSADITCMIRIRGSGSAVVLTGGMDFVVKVWDNQGILVSQSAHHHASVSCAVQMKLAGLAPRETGAARIKAHQILTGSSDGLVFKWDDANQDGKVSKDEGQMLKHTSGEGITFLAQVGDFIWAGTEKGKVAVWDSLEVNSVCEVSSAHRDRISAIVVMGTNVWTGGSDKVISSWDASMLPARPRLLFSISEGFGYIKSMLRIGWALWIFHSKGLHILSSESVVEESEAQRDRALEKLRKAGEQMAQLREDLARENFEKETITGRMADAQLEHKRNVETLEATVSRLESDIKGLEEEKDELGREADASRQRTLDLESQVTSSKEELEQTVALNKAEAREAQGRLTEDLARLTEELSAKSKKVEDLEDQSKALSEKVATYELDMEGQARELAGEVDNYKNLLRASEDDKADLRSRHMSEVKALEDKLSREASAHAALEEERKMEAEGERTKAEEARKLLQAKIYESRKSHAEMEITLHEKGNALAQTKAELEQLESQIEQVQASHSKSIEDLKTKFDAKIELQAQEHNDAISELAKDKESLTTALNSRVDALKREKALAKADLEASVKQVSQMSTRLEEAGQKEVALMGQIERLQDNHEVDMGTLKQEKAVIAKELEALKVDHEKSKLASGDRFDELLEMNKRELRETEEGYAAQLEEKNREVTAALEERKYMTEDFEQQILALKEAASSRDKDMKEEIGHLQSRIAERDSELDDLRGSYQESRGEITSLIEQRKELEAKAEESRSVLQTQLDEAVASLSRARADVSSMKDSREGQMRELQETLQEEREKFEAEINKSAEESSQKLSQLEEEVQVEKAARAEATKLQENAERQMQAAQDQTDRAKADVENVRREMDSALQELRSEADQAERRRKQAEGLFQEQEADLRAAQNESEMGQRALEELQKAKKASEDRMEQLFAEEREHLATEKKELEDNLEDIGRQLAESLEEKEQCQRELQDLSENFQGKLKAEKENMGIDLLEVSRQAEQTWDNLFHKIYPVLSEKDRTSIKEFSVDSAPGIEKAIKSVIHLKGALSGMVEPLVQTLLDMKRQARLEAMRVDEMQVQTIESREKLERKRKKKRHWKLSYLQLSASQAEEVAELQVELKQVAQALDNQKSLYKKSQQALQEAAYQLHHAKELEGALAQSQREYTALVSSLSHTRQQAELAQSELREQICALESQLTIQGRAHNRERKTLGDEIRVLRDKAASAAAPCTEESKGGAAEDKVQERAENVEPVEQENVQQSVKRRERYAGFVC